MLNVSISTGQYINTSDERNSSATSINHLRTLKMYTKSVSEMLVYLNYFTRLSAREDFTEHLIIYRLVCVDILSVDVGTKIVKHG
jgi:hypothetical protein